MHRPAAGPWPVAITACAAGTVLLAAPLAGWPPVVRVSVVLAPVLALGLWRLACVPWNAPDCPPPWSTRRIQAVWIAGLFAVLFWIVITRFFSGEINAVDFTIYFDRPLYQTSQGRPLYVETTDDPRFSHLTHLAVHGYWALLPLAALYTLYATPLWLLALSVVAIVAGAVHVLRIARLLGFPMPLAVATTLAFVLNDNTARALNYGFHPELLYAWFVPWMPEAGLRRARAGFLAAMAACVLVKEDAVFLLFAVAVSLALLQWRRFTRSERLVFLLLPPAVGLAGLAFYYAAVVPALAPGGQVMNAYFWWNYGQTPTSAFGAMLRDPVRVLRDVWTSGLFTIALRPHLWLPLAGWRWSLGTLPLVVLYATAANAQLREFGIYYAVVLVPFFTLGASAGALAIVRRIHGGAPAVACAAGILTAGALLAGGGYSLRPWKAEIANVTRALELLAEEPTVLVQSALYPHAGYDARIQLLTPQTLHDPTNAGAAILLARNLSAYPFDRTYAKHLLKLPRVAEMPQGLVAVRVQPRRTPIDGRSEPRADAPATGEP